MVYVKCTNRVCTVAPSNNGVRREKEESESAPDKMLLCRVKKYRRSFKCRGARPAKERKKEEEEEEGGFASMFYLFLIINLLCQAYLKLQD